MAGHIGLKLGGMVEGICENVLTKPFFNFWNPRWPPNGLYIKKEFFVFFGLNNSEMARPIMLKFGGMVEGICKNNLAE